MKNNNELLSDEQLKVLAEDIEAAELEGERTCGSVHSMKIGTKEAKALISQAKRVNELEAEVERVREALEIYSSVKNIRRDPDGDLVEIHEDEDRSFGYSARQALKDIRGQG